ncbi:hypothetical protein Bca52824_080265 [Brassica carinata]|uniref:Uncharacterized protein n=1 Tax=Brassica carinata TaxID=52824 RepID=A0A8X7PD05_BRACI|nr:hypothetical protein Bca52824_080265 [Brassica carinata]
MSGAHACDTASLQCGSRNAVGYYITSCFCVSSCMELSCTSSPPSYVDTQQECTIDRHNSLTIDRFSTSSETGNEHRPTLPTTHRSKQKSTECESETTRLAVGQMITIHQLWSRNSNVAPRADELHEGLTYEELLNMQRRDETDQHRSEAALGRT